MKKSKENSGKSHLSDCFEVLDDSFSPEVILIPVF